MQRLLPVDDQRYLTVPVSVRVWMRSLVIEGVLLGVNVILRPLSTPCSIGSKVSSIQRIDARSYLALLFPSDGISLVLDYPFERLW